MDKQETIVTCPSLSTDASEHRWKYADAASCRVGITRKVFVTGEDQSLAELSYFIGREMYIIVMNNDHFGMNRLVGWDYIIVILL